jgi:hypothetical protein
VYDFTATNQLRFDDFRLPAKSMLTGYTLGNRSQNGVRLATMRPRFPNETALFLMSACLLVEALLFVR